MGRRSTPARDGFVHVGHGPRITEAGESAVRVATGLVLMAIGLIAQPVVRQGDDGAQAPEGAARLVIAVIERVASAAWSQELLRRKNRCGHGRCYGSAASSPG